MKHIKSLVLLAAVFYLILNGIAAANELIPAVQSGLYYKLGGGNDVPLPAFYDTSTIPLSAEGDVGLGFNCGAFNPAASLTNSLNQIKSSFLAVKQQVLSDATSAVTEFPLYELSRADPNLYNLLTNAIAGAQKNLSISTKSCQVMQSEIASGGNPYAHWGQISLGNKWRTEIGSALISNNGDINQARYNASQDAGKSGIPWVNPASFLLGSNWNYHAGGVNQPPIHVIRDTAAAGYQVIITGSAKTGIIKNTHFLKSGKPELERVWSTPKEAADWIMNVAGEQVITTYNDGPKSSQSGVGLYSDIQYQMQQIEPKLQALVTGSTEPTLKNLQELSIEGMALSPETIHSIQNQPKVIQAVIVNKLAQNLAAMRVINKARLAIQILQSGSKIPEIFSNEAAQKNIKNAISLVQQDVQNILMFVKARQMLMSNMMSTIIQANKLQIQKNTEISMPKSDMPLLEKGAVSDAR